VSGLDYYAGLLEMRPHVSAFLKSIASVVRPGDRVVEIGCGLGTYALAAARAGAARVDAIDWNPWAIALAREMGVERQSGGRVHLVEGSAERVRLEQPADVVIFEDFGGFGFRSRLRPLYDHIRTRLAHPDARYIPSAVELMLAPVDHELRTIGPAAAQALPFSRESLALLRRRALNEPAYREANSRWLAGAPRRIAVLRPQDGVPTHACYAATTRAARTAQIRGMLGWIRLLLPPRIVIDNGPRARSRAWGSRLFPISEPLPCRKGERVKMTMEVSKGLGPLDSIWRWRLQSPRGEREGCNVNALPESLDLLRRGSPDSVPRATRQARLLADVLREIDGTKNVSAIARAMYTLYTDQFTSESHATEHVLEVLDRLRDLMENRE
jgi:SAM-dependent methyltransferase